MLTRTSRLPASRYQQRPATVLLRSFVKLPDELWSHILSLARTTEPDSYEDSEHRTKLMLVCRAWFNVITTTGSYWTNIVVLFSDGSGVERLAAHLKRSGELPIRVRIDRLAEPWAQGVKDALEMHLSRCITLYVSFEDVGAMGTLLPLRGKADKLKEIEIDATRLPDITRHPFHGRPLFSPDNTSPLRTLHLRGSFAVSLTGIPAAGIKTITLDSDLDHAWRRWDDIMALLACCSAATTVTVLVDQRVNGYVRPPLPPMMIELPQCTTLVINDETSMEFQRFMATPKLRHLTCIRPFWTHVATPSMTPIPTTSSFSLRSLTLVSVALHGEHLAEAFPTLESLTLYGCSSDMTLAPLVERGAENHRLTRLSYLVIRNHKNTHVRPIMVVAIVYGLLRSRPTLCVHWHMQESEVDRHNWGSWLFLAKTCYGSRFTIDMDHDVPTVLPPPPPPERF